MTTPPQHRWEVAARRELDPAEGGHCCLERGPWRLELARGDVMAGCPAHVAHEDKGQLLASVADHAAAAHGITDVSPEVFRLVDAAVVRVA